VEDSAEVHSSSPLSMKRTEHTTESTSGELREKKRMILNNDVRVV
jgi:hypothetical protein